MGRFINKFLWWAAIWFWLVLSISIGIGFGIGIGFPKHSDLNYVNGYPYVPYFYKGPESQTVFTGERVVMSCIVKKETFQFGLHWLHDNVYLNVESARNPIYWVSSDSSLMGNYTLIIDNVTVDDAGEYKCVLMNGTGHLWEDNLQKIRKSPVGYLEVVELELEPERSTTPDPLPLPQTEVPLYRLAPILDLTEKPTKILPELTPALEVLLPSQSSEESTSSTEEVLESVIKQEHDLDWKGSMGILPTSDLGLKPPKKDEGVAGNPPDLDIAPGDWDDSMLPYYILAGLSVVAVGLVILLTAVLCGKCDSCKCPCKPRDPEQSCPNINFNESEDPDGAQNEIKMESDENKVR